MGPPREPLPAPTGAALPASLLTLREAARLTGLRRRALRQRVRRGQVAVRVIAKGRTTKLRLTPDALAAAGLLPTGAPDRPDPPSAGADPELPTALLDLIREQNGRITTLEEQRFQLAGQLGAALERAHALEERVLALSTSSPSTAVDTASRQRGTIEVASARQRPPRRSSFQAGPDQADSAPARSRARWPRRALATLRRVAAVAAARRATRTNTDLPHSPPST